MGIMADSLDVFFFALFFCCCVFWILSVGGVVLYEELPLTLFVALCIDILRFIPDTYSWRQLAADFAR